MKGTLSPPLFEKKRGRNIFKGANPPFLISFFLPLYKGGGIDC
jgi:hypothetical protein